MNQDKIDRINELAWKSRTEGLTEEETAEREQLREEYVSSVRQSLESHLENIYVKDEDGNEQKLQKKE